MKLATYRDGSRDGQLVVVSRDLALAHYATGIATRLQQVLDDWNFLSPQLEDLSATLNDGKARHAFAFDPRQCMAPLPRCSQFVLADAWAAAEAEPGTEGAPTAADAHPRLQPAAGDDLLGPTQPFALGAPGWQADAEPLLAVVTGDLASGASPGQGLDAVRLLLLGQAWVLRALEAAEREAGLAVLAGRPSTAFAPVAVTPDELDDAWQDGRLQAMLQIARNGRRSARLDTGLQQRWSFGSLVAALARTRNLRAGCIVGVGPVRAADAAQGFGCIAERRLHEAATDGDARTPWLLPGEVLRTELIGRDGQSVFGAIEQTVTGPGGLLPPDDAAADAPLPEPDAEGADASADTEPQATADGTADPDPNPDAGTATDDATRAA